MALNIEQALRRAVLAHEGGKLQEAERLYRSILLLDPLQADANHNLGLLSAFDDDFAAALPFFKKALVSNPKTEQFWLSYIKTLIRGKQFETARHAIESARENGISGARIDVLMEELITETTRSPRNNGSPSHKQTSSLLQFYKAGDLIEAETLASSMTEEFPSHQFGWKILGAVLRQRGDVSGSLFACQKAADLSPEDAHAHSNLGIIFKEMGRFNEAEACLRRAIALKADLVEAYNSLGNTLQQLDRLDEAEASLRHAISLKSDYPEAHNNLGLILQQLGKFSAAKASYIQAIVLKPNFAEVYNNLGIMLQELGEIEEAETNWKKAISIEPNYADAYFNFGILLKTLRRYDEAEVCYRSAISLKPKSFSIAYDHLAFILQKKKKFDEAEEFYKKYSSLEPIKPSETVSKGDFFYKQGNYERALHLFDSYNTKTSRARALESLYALGRIEEIYKRIIDNSKVDGRNIRVAAISAFLAKQQNKETAHNFCNNPLDFINISNISSHVQNANLFITELIGELKKVKVYSGVNTTKNGFQARSNIFKNSSEKIACLKSIIENELISYHSKYDDETCKYISDWPFKINLSGWHVILKRQGYQTAHIHPNGWLSGVIYLKVVPSLGNNEGAIEFSLNGPNYFDVRLPKMTHQPKLGDIVLFPSSLHHRTLPYSTNMDRICVSFDLIPTREMDY